MVSKKSESKNECNCQRKILLVDDSDYNLLALKGIINSLFNDIILHEA